MEWIQKSLFANITGQSSLRFADQVGVLHVCLQVFIVFEYLLANVAFNSCVVVLGNVTFDVFGDVPEKCRVKLSN